MKENDFEIKFKNLLAFSCIIGSISNNFDNIEIKEVDYNYIFEKYLYYIKSDNKLSKNEQENILEYVNILKKLNKPDILIFKWNECFGKDSFFDISNKPNYKNSLHTTLRKYVFEAYLDTLLNASRRYKIWKIENDI